MKVTAAYLAQASKGRFSETSINEFLELFCEVMEPSSRARTLSIDGVCAARFHAAPAQYVFALGADKPFYLVGRVQGPRFLDDERVLLCYAEARLSLLQPEVSATPGGNIIALTGSYVLDTINSRYMQALEEFALLRGAHTHTQEWAQKLRMHEREPYRVVARGNQRKSRNKHFAI